MIFDLMRLVISDMWKKKFSSFMTLFAISLGIVAIVVIILTSMGFEKSIQDQFEEYGANRIYVMPGSGPLGGGSDDFKLTDDEVELLKQQSYIQDAQGYFTQRTTITQGNEQRRGNLIGIRYGNFFQDYNFDFSEGREPRMNEDSAVVFGSRAAEELFSREVRIGTSIEIRDERFKIVGILEEVGNPEDDNQIYFELDTLRNLFGSENEVEMIEILLVSGQNIEIAEENIQNLLDRRLGENRVSVITPDQLLEQLNDILAIIQYTLGGIALISLLVGALGIINTMYVIVTEKTKDIGIMKSVGAKNSDILFMFTLMSAAFGFLGAVLGIILGSLGVIGLESIAQASGFAFLSIPLDPFVLFSILIFGIVIGIVSGFLPSLKASKITIIDTLRK